MNTRRLTEGFGAIAIRCFPFLRDIVPIRRWAMERVVRDRDRDRQTTGTATSSLSRLMNETERKSKRIACHNPCTLISQTPIVT